ncbi:unnamed protein product [Laminaria digitata]
MVDVCSKRCFNDSCTRHPSFNVEGSKTSAYCKQHADDGMLNVYNKRCLHDSCTRHQSFNVEGSKTSAYCKQHAADGMVDVRMKRCLHDSCTRHPSFNLEGSKTPAYCKQHAQEGVVNVRTNRSLHDCRATGAERGVPSNDPATPCTTRNNDVWDGSILKSDLSCELLNGRKRPRLDVDSNHRQLCLDQGTLTEGGASQMVGMDPKTGVLDTSSSRSSQEHLNGSTVRSTPKETHQVMPPTVAPVPDENELESGAPIKTEMEISVSI